MHLQKQKNDSSCTLPRKVRFSISIYATLELSELRSDRPTSITAHSVDDSSVSEREHVLEEGNGLLFETLLLREVVEQTTL